MKCYACKDELTIDNRSVEHILPNSIGGKLKSSDLLCNGCNSKFGDSSDAELSKQLSFLSSFLEVKRERGNHPTIKGATLQNGEEIQLLEGGKPYLAKPFVSEIKNEKEIVINIKARDKKELRCILRGFAKKYPQIDLESIVESAQVQETYLKEPIKYQQTIGGNTAFRAILKIAVNFLILKTKNYEVSDKLLPLLLSEGEIDVCKHFYPVKNLYKKEVSEICHVIHIQSNKYHKNLVAYIELFSSYSFIVMLDDNYTGKNLKYTYCYDITQNKESQKNIDLKISTTEFLKLEVISTRYFGTIVERLDRLMKITLEKQKSKGMSDIVSRCVDEILVTKYGHEPVITKQMTSELSHMLATEIVKFIYRL